MSRSSKIKIFSLIFLGVYRGSTYRGQRARCRPSSILLGTPLARGPHVYPYPCTAPLAPCMSAWREMQMWQRTEDASPHTTCCFDDLHSKLTESLTQQLARAELCIGGVKPATCCEQNSQVCMCRTAPPHMHVCHKPVPQTNTLVRKSISLRSVAVIYGTVHAGQSHY